MKLLKKGQYFGDSRNVIQMENLVLTETEFTGNHVDWHFHENVHFSYSIYGNSCQISKKSTHRISNGTLIYHNAQDPHFNTKHSKYSKNFYVEIEDDWFKHLNLDKILPEGVINLHDPNMKMTIDQIYYEVKVNDSTSKLAIESHLINAVDILNELVQFETSTKPTWVHAVRELLHERFDENLSLKEISQEVEIHPVHLSRQFPKHFGQSLSQYIRNIKIHKAATLLKKKELSIVDICYRTGFSDQSHLSRCFKKVFKTTPHQYRKKIN